ncbi:DUF3644 domain-containing protein [Helicobacter sp. MIT 05-5293]|uniref:DUF3644 domain-containing protein n=1 Tax=Helicobacter sp. MIT 05-5293 TaxID=1548149 RepID=UPI00051E0506|nr:DUF3644 domain-containing protein [Helicobacter sp. MIT 05-5293]TLD80882.1 DUF3644 domain-containing protein [Helicobacter sp. MIT 05-5293]
MRNRKLKSISSELLKKSKESALAAVQIFNNPNMLFKSESFIVLIIIAWTYLLHSYYKSKKVDYRYCEARNKRKKFHKTKNGNYKYWELERCLKDENSPIDNNTSNNLKFLIGLRHEIEHQMTTKIDDLLSARFQACCLNYNDYLKKLFNDKGIDKYLSFSIQFSSITEEQKDLLQDSTLPKNILNYIQTFDDSLSDDEFNSPKFSYRILFIPKSVNHRGQADKVIEFIKSDSQLAQEINQSYAKSYAFVKETEKEKFLPKHIVELMKDKGYTNFSIHKHTDLWRSKKAKESNLHYGVNVEGKWYWYKKWVDEVERYCQEHKDELI